MHGKGGKAMALVSQSELAGKIIKLTAMRLDTKLPWLKEAIHLPESSFDLKQTSGTDGSRLCWNTEEVFKTYAEDPVLLEIPASDPPSSLSASLSQKKRDRIPLVAGLRLAD